jgi:hypothetical protein
MNSPPKDVVSCIDSYLTLGETGSLSGVNRYFRDTLSHPDIDGFLAEFKEVCDEFSREIDSFDDTTRLRLIQISMAMTVIRLMKLHEKALVLEIAFVVETDNVSKMFARNVQDLKDNYATLMRTPPESFKKRSHAINAWMISLRDCFTMISHLPQKWKYCAGCKIRYDEQAYYLPSTTHLVPLSERK